MGTRIKPEAGKIESVEDVNFALREIGLAQKELDAIDSEANKQIAEIKTGAAKDGEKLRKKIAETSARIQAFADYNRDDLFTDKKTIELSFGFFGYRKSTKISVRKTTVELLKKLHLDKYVRTKEEPDKDSMAELDDETLTQVDAVRKISDDFFCEAKTEEINRDLLKSAS